MTKVLRGIAACFAGAVLFPTILVSVTAMTANILETANREGQLGTIVLVLMLAGAILGLGYETGYQKRRAERDCEKSREKKP